MAVPAYKECNLSIYLQPIYQAKRKPAPKQQPAAIYALLLVFFLFLSIAVSQTVQIRQLSQQTRSLKEQTMFVQQEREMLKTHFDHSF